MDVARDIIVSVSAGVVAVVALLGLTTWKKELTGKVKFDIARNVMFLSLKFKSDFQRARFPLGSSAEYADRPRQESEDPRETNVRNGWYARMRRLQPLIEDLAKLEEAAWEAEVVLNDAASKSVSQAFAVFRRFYGELASASDAYFEEELRQATGSGRTDADWLKELSKIIFSASEDDFIKQIAQATEQLASALKPYVK